MNGEKKSPAKAINNKAVEKKAAEDRYEVNVLRKYAAEKLGISSSTFEAAFFGKTGTFTIKQMKAIIDEWLGKPLNKKEAK